MKTNRGHYILQAGFNLGEVISLHSLWHSDFDEFCDSFLMEFPIFGTGTLQTAFAEGRNGDFLHTDVDLEFLFSREWDGVEAWVGAKQG